MLTASFPSTNHTVRKDESTMTPQEVISQTYLTSSMVLRTYLSDLTDAELLYRPGRGCQHLAWQLGHLIASEPGLLNGVCPGAGAELPSGFAEQHAKDKSDSNSASDFCTKDEYLRLMDLNQQAALKAFASVTAEQLDESGPEFMKPMFPTVGSILILVATHAMMHAGQFVPVRRSLGKPVLI